jgi:hypothetical protein
VTRHPPNPPPRWLRRYLLCVVSRRRGVLEWVEDRPQTSYCAALLAANASRTGRRVEICGGLQPQTTKSGRVQFGHAPHGQARQAPPARPCSAGASERWDWSRRAGASVSRSSGR